MNRALFIGLLVAAGVAEAKPRAPEPELRPGRQPRARDSVLTLSAEVPLKTVEALARHHIPARKRWRAPAYTHPVNGGAGTVDGISIGYDIVSGVASVRAGSRGEIVTVIPVSYSIWARYQPVSRGPSFDAKCVRRTASLVLTTRLTVSRSRLTPKTRASVAARSRCVITRLRIDVTDLLTSLVGSRLRRVTRDIDRKIADAFEVGAAAKIAWRKLADPRRVSGGWLDLNPSAMQMPPIEASGTRLEARLQVIAKSALRFGGPRPRRRPAPSPSVDSHSSPPRLSVLVEVTVDDAALDRFATSALEAARTPGRITGAVLRPRGRRVAIGVDVARVGRLWLVGDLGAEKASGDLEIASPRLTGKSRAMLSGSRIRPAALESAVGDALETVAIRAVDDLRARAQDALTESLSSAVPLLSGAAAIERIRFASAVAGDGKRRFYFRAEGTSVGARPCSIRARGHVMLRDQVCTRKKARRHCHRDRGCAYSTDGETWVPVY